MKKVGIIGVGEYLPKKVLTNEDLEKMVDTSDDWITTRTGIKQRRIVEPGTPASVLAAEAAKNAIKDAGLKPEKIELIIVTTVTPDMQFPSTACVVQAKIGAKKAACLDISAACSGFVYGIAIAQGFISSNIYKNVLVVGAEILSSITDWKDRNTCVLFGDGAGAAVLAPVKKGGILSVYLGSDGTSGDLLKLPGGGSLNPPTHKTVDEGLHYLKMRGNELFKLAVKTMQEAAQVALKKAELTCKDVDLVIPHQANIRILMAMAKRLGIPENKIFLNIEKYGNMSSASTATALCEAVKSGRVKKGDIILLDTFGGGLVWASAVIKW